MKHRKLALLLPLVALATQGVHAQVTLAEWTFESSVPATAGPFSPEVGAGSALGFHAGAAVYSNPSGNGSVESFSVNTWATGDFWQFQVDATGVQDLAVSFDQTSSSTGPRDFDLAWSTDGVNFTTFSTYAVLQNGGTPNLSWSSGGGRQSAYTFSFDLSPVSALDNDSSVFFRLVNTTTTSVSGGTVAASGTDRLDNVLVTATAVPEPATVALGAGGLLGCVFLRFRRRR